VIEAGVCQALGWAMGRPLARARSGIARETRERLLGGSAGRPAAAPWVTSGSVRGAPIGPCRPDCGLELHVVRERRRTESVVTRPSGHEREPARRESDMTRNPGDRGPGGPVRVRDDSQPRWPPTDAGSRATLGRRARARGHGHTGSGPRTCRASRGPDLLGPDGEGPLGPPGAGAPPDWRAAGRAWPAGAEPRVGHGWRPVEHPVEPVEAVARPHPAGAPGSVLMGCSKGHHARSVGHLCCCPGSWLTPADRWIRG